MAVLFRGVVAALGNQAGNIAWAHGWPSERAVELYTGTGAWVWLGWIALLVTIGIFIDEPAEPKE